MFSQYTLPPADPIQQQIHNMSGRGYIQSGGKYYGEGSYGCVIDTLDCLNRPLRDDEVVKIMRKKDAIDEFESSKKIQEIDPNNDFTIEAPIFCETVDERLTNDAINDLAKCKHLLDDYKKRPDSLRDNLDKYSMLIMKNAGDALHDYETDKKLQDKIKEVWKTKEGKLKILNGLRRLFVGIDILISKNMSHNDIKPGNIILNPINYEFNLIDFGFINDGLIKPRSRAYFVNLWLKIYLKDDKINMLFNHFEFNTLDKENILNDISLNLNKYEEGYLGTYASEYLPSDFMDISKATNDLYDLVEYIYNQIKKYPGDIRYMEFHKKYHQIAKIYNDSHMLGIALFPIMNILIPNFRDGENMFPKWGKLEKDLYKLLWRMITHNYVDKSQPQKMNCYNILEEFDYILEYCKKANITMKNTISKQIKTKTKLKSKTKTKTKSKTKKYKPSRSKQSNSTRKRSTNTIIN
jgi:hypothetical protein